MATHVGFWGTSGLDRRLDVVMRRLLLACLLVGCRSVPAASPVVPSEPVRTPDTDDSTLAPTTRLLDEVTALAVASSHGCALREDRSVWCWGSNSTGELARDDEQRSLWARRIEGLPPAAQIAAGDDHNCIIDLEGSVWCWGANFYGQVDADRGRTAVPDWVSIAWCGSPPDVDRDNMRFTPQRVAFVHGAQQLALGSDHTCARTDEGVVCWGSAVYGAVGRVADAAFLRVTTPLPGGAQAVVAGRVHTCALDGEGDTWCWGDELIGESTPAAPHRVSGVPKGRDLAIRADHTCVLGVDDSVWCWGGTDAYLDEDGHAPDPWLGYHPVPAAMPMPGPWSGFVHVNGFPCMLGDGGRVDCQGRDDDDRPRAVPVVGLSAPAVELSGQHAVCSRSSAGRVHCFSAHEEHYYAPDWAGPGGRALPVMVEGDLSALFPLPAGALTRPRARPPAESRVCESTVGRCVHRLGAIECTCHDGTERSLVDPSGVAWYDDQQCVDQLATVCGAAPPTEVGVACRGEDGRCSVMGSSGSWSCGCTDGSAVASSGDDDWSDRSDAQLVEICRQQIDRECG